VHGTMSLCREHIAAVYNDVVSDASSDAALQLLGDVAFLEIALAGRGKGEFNRLREELVKKVSVCPSFTKSSVMRRSWVN
jgi:hypothetical protein